MIFSSFDRGIPRIGDSLRRFLFQNMDDINGICKAMPAEA
ncbi:hypothetical protein L288_14370 [Sphingobium quisquiliarum P25]|uniref:Uncharacterized protein n=1 Tax=Sphingobium quisquiliarum P25 TaxID=1329909 RepID=T0HY42_9SPHN|nr:hypothetical protein L288_14370 [Sphingobium quisquiliarum P25]